MKPETVYDANNKSHLMFKELPNNVMKVDYLFGKKLLDEYWINKKEHAIIKKNVYSKQLKDYKYMITLKYKLSVKFIDKTRDILYDDFLNAFVKEWNLRERYCIDCYKKYFS